jgi:hypothetical protein
MPTEIHRYTFDSAIAFEDVEASLLLAIFAAESLHGESEVRLDAAHAVDADQRSCVIDASTQVGRDINRLFTGFVLREFGPDSFRVQRVDHIVARQPQEVHV